MSPGDDRGGPREEAASYVVTTDNQTVRQTAENLTQIQRRLVLEAVQTAEAWWWLRRAEEYEAARPRPEEFHGRASRADLSRRWCDLTELAQACRARAAMARRGVDEDELAGLYEQVVAC